MVETEWAGPPAEECGPPMRRRVAGAVPDGGPDPKWEPLCFGNAVVKLVQEPTLPLFSMIPHSPAVLGKGRLRRGKLKYWSIFEGADAVAETRPI